MSRHPTLTNLTGNNTFTVGGWTGSGSITGGGGSDTIASSRDGNVVLSNSQLLVTNTTLANLSPNGIGTADRMAASMGSIG